MVGSALVTAAISVFVASAIFFAPTPESAQAGPHSAPLYRLSPIPAGADWDRS
jgi:hypothetical protein